MLKRIVGYSIYYMIFTVIAIISIFKHWPLTPFFIIALIIILYVSIGGEENDLSKIGAYRRDPMLVQDMPEKPDDSSSLPLLSILLIIFPIIIYILCDFFVF